MMHTHSPVTRERVPTPTLRASMKYTLTKLSALLLLLVCATAAGAQTSKLPSPERIVGDYVKAIGGKKRLAALRDATYEWTVQGPAFGDARARSYAKAPSSGRLEIFTERGSIVAAANARTVWERFYDGPVETRVGGEAFSSKLQATLSASHMLDFKKLKIMARTVGVEEVDGEKAYVVEFSTREGGRYRVWFSVVSKLSIKEADEVRKAVVKYSDYRPVGGILEAYRAVQEDDGHPTATFTLQSASYNTGLADSLFEPPADTTLDIPALLRDLSKNQEEDDKRINDYTFTQKVTERELDDKGRVKKEKVSVFEVYPIADYGWVQKMIVENGVPLSPERMAKEEKRVAEELEKAEREAPKLKEKREQKRSERRAKRRAKAGDRSKSNSSDEEEDDDDVEISTFLRACEFFSPRRERFRDRDVIVFDFRPRAGFKPSNTGETIVSKLSGVIWIDPSERHVMRLEARLVDSFKMGGGLVASIKPGSAFIFEQTRLPEGVWLPRFSQVNASARVFLFAGMSINETREFGDFKRFSTKSGEDTLDTPKPEKQ